MNQKVPVTTDANAGVPVAPPHVALWPLSAYFLRLGTTGFGGPIALAGFMQRDLVEERGWVTREEYLDGLALAQLAPGPLAAQLAMYLGYVRGGVWGATAVSICFILPSFLMVWAISAAYVHFGGLPWMQSLFYGVGAAVIGIIARSVQKLTKLTISGPVLWGIFWVMAVTTAWTQREILWLFLMAGLVTSALKWHSRIRWTRRHDGCARHRRPARPGGVRAPMVALHQQHLLAVRQGWRLRVRERTRDRAVPLRRTGPDAWLAQRSGSFSMPSPSR